MKKNAKSIFFVIFLVGIILCTPILLNRIKYEKNNDTYEITVSLESTLNMNDKELNRFYKEIKKLGIHTIVSDNTNLKALENYRDLDILSVKELKISDYKNLLKYIPEGVNKDNIVIVINKSDFLDRELDRITDYLDDAKVHEDDNQLVYFIDKPISVPKEGNYVLNPVLSKNFFIDEKSLKSIYDNGLTPMLAVTNDKGDEVQDLILEQILYLSKDYGIDKVQLRGESILGYKDNLSKYIDELQANDISVVTTEFQTKVGLSTYANKNEGTMLRGHEINVINLKLNEKELGERIARAVKERNMRFISIRNFADYSTSDTVKEGIKDLKKAMISAQDQLEGQYVQGEATPIPMMKRQPVQEVFVAVAFAALVGVLMLSLFGKMPKLAWVMFVISLVGALVATFANISIFTKAYAFGVSIIGATGAVIIPWKLKKDSVTLKYITSFVICLATGIMIASIMYGTNYMLKLQSFSGVKLLYVLPPALVGLWLLLEYKILSIENIKYPEKFKNNVVNGIKNIKFYHIVIVVVVLAAAYIYLLRSGNSGNATELELSIRAYLEKLLYVRPRTKEFMLGYPALLMAFYYFNKKSKYAAYLLIPGAIATMSTVNTFTHLHTPFLYSLLRSVYGVVFGAVVAAIYILIINLLVKLFKRFSREA